MQGDEGLANTQNIFAYELQRVLRQHGLGLEQLDDRVGIHSEKVQQLVRSLQGADIFPILSVDQMDQLIKALALNEADVARLHMAIQATTSQMEELDNNQQEAQSSNSQDLGNKRGGEPGSRDDSGINRVLAPILDRINRGNIAVQHSSSYAPGTIGKKENALKARTYFEEAITKLDRLPDDIRRAPMWHDWKKEAKQGLAHANSLLR